LGQELWTPNVFLSEVGISLGWLCRVDNLSFAFKILGLGLQAGRTLKLTEAWVFSSHFKLAFFGFTCHRVALVGGLLPGDLRTRFIRDGTADAAD